MTILVVGGSGATGQQLVTLLLKQGQNVKAILRSARNLPESLRNQTHLSIIEASVLALSDSEMAVSKKSFFTNLKIGKGLISNVPVDNSN